VTKFLDFPIETHNAKTLPKPKFVTLAAATHQGENEWVGTGFVLRDFANGNGLIGNSNFVGRVVSRNWRSRTPRSNRENQAPSPENSPY